MLLLTFFIFLLLGKRNNLIFKIRNQAIKKIYDENIKNIGTSKTRKEYDSILDKPGSYYFMVIDLRKWTFKDFYPNL
jgi:hypothetical protein